MKAHLQSLLSRTGAIAMAGFLCMFSGCNEPPRNEPVGYVYLTSPAQAARLTALTDISGTYVAYGTLNSLTVTLMRYSDSKFWNGSTSTWGASFDLPTTPDSGNWHIATGTALPMGSDPNTGLIDDWYLITVSAMFDAEQKTAQGVFNTGVPAPPVLPAPWAWGDNGLGALGNAGLGANRPQRVFTQGTLDGKVIARLAGGGGHSLALTSEGLVYAWGSDSSGQLGSTALPPPDPFGTRFWSPVKVDVTPGVLAGKRIESIAAGGEHSLAASSDGLVFAWGSDFSGQIGDGGTFGSGVKAEVPVAVTGQLAGKHVIAVSAGGSHSLALTDDADGRKVYTWGIIDYVEYGDQADGNINHFSTAPVAVTGLGGVPIATIACGSTHNLALTDDGKLYAWGQGLSGRLGNGGTATSNTPMLISGPWGTKKLVSCAAGAEHSLAVDEDGKVYSWGGNLKGELGTGNQTDQLSPVEVTALSGQIVTQVVASHFFSLAWTSNNKVYSWGDNREGQLARSAPPFDYAPDPGEADLSVPLADNRVILGLSAGGYHVLLLTGFTPDPKPEIEVEAQGVELTDGGSINFGAVGQGSSNPIFIKVRNGGTTGSYLKDLSAAVSGAGFSGIFTAPPLATDGETGFYVFFQPNTTGAASGTVQIFSDDADENPFDITLTGSAYPVGQVDLPFNPGVTGDVYGTAVQPDGMAVVTGSFVQVNASGTPVPRNRAARVQGVTGLADAFNPDLDSFSYCSAVLPDGRIMVGGGFNTVGGVARNRLTRLNADGTLDTSFNAQITFSGTVYAMALQADGKLVVAGNFSGIGGGTQPNVARLNASGTLDTGFTPALSSPGRGVAVQADGSIVVLTSLSASERTVARLSGVDGSLDPSFTRPTIITDGNPLLDCVAVQPDGKILVGGYVKTVNGETRNGICRINTDGLLDMGFDPDVGGTFPQVTSIVVQADKRILISGSFTSVGGQTRNRIAKLLPNGQLEQFFDPNADSSVFGVTSQADGKILACGGFSNIGGAGRGKLARLSNDVATQSLSVVDNNSRIEWLRGGSSPETNLVTFDASSDGGANWTPLGAGTRLNPSTPGWQLTGATLPPTGHIRARAYPQGGRYNGSVSCLETITSYGTPPDIVVTENAVPFTSGFTRQFGVVATGSAASVMQLTIQNAGGTALTGLSSVTIDDDLAVTGDHTSQFQLGKPAAIALAPGATTTMTVTYKPKTTGRHAAILRIPSNDPDTNPFGIFLTGLGSLPITTWKEIHYGQTENTGAAADTAIAANGNSNQVNYGTGIDPFTGVGDGTSVDQPTGGSPFAPTTNGAPPIEGTFAFHYQRNKLSLADIIFQVEWSDTLAPNDWHTTGVTEQIDSDDDTIQLITATVPAGIAGHRFVRLKMTRP